MKTILTAAFLIAMWLPSQATAQFPFPGNGKKGGNILPDIGRQFQNQLRREIQNQGGRILNDIDRAIGGNGNIRLPKPPEMQPVPLPYPAPKLPYPKPHPQPCPVIIQPGPGIPPGTGGGCRIVPKPYPQPEPQPQPEPAPAATSEPLPQIESGQVVTLEDGEFGEEIGAVLVKIDALVLTAELIDWSSETVEAKMPRLPMAAAAEALVAVVDSNGDIAESISIELLPPTQTEETAPEQEEVADLPEVFAGQEVAVEGAFGEKPGKVELHIGKLVLTAKVIEWTAEEATIEIPELSFDEPVAGSLVVTSAEGELAEQLDVLLNPAEADDAVAVADK